MGMRAMRFFAAIAALVMLAAGSVCQAQTYPDRPVTIVVPAPPGGGMDAVLRTIGEDIAAELGQRLVLENKSGANGEIGARFVAGAQPNGYTLLFINPFVDSPTGFDFATDLLPVEPVTKIMPWCWSHNFLITGGRFSRSIDGTSVGIARKVAPGPVSLRNTLTRKRPPCCAT